MTELWESEATGDLLDAHMESYPEKEFSGEEDEAEEEAAEEGEVEIVEAGEEAPAREPRELTEFQKQQNEIKEKYYFDDHWNPEEIDDAWFDSSLRLDMERAAKSLIQQRKKNPDSKEHDLIAKEVLMNYQNAYYNERGSE
jgi:hypothetical protein